MSALPLAKLPEAKSVAPPLSVARPVAAAPRNFHDLGAGLVAHRALCEINDAPDLSPGDAIHSDQDLVVRLCRMPVDLAAPLLRASLPTLTPQALLALIVATGEAHHRLIAARPGLDWRVIKALIRTQNDDVIVTLIRNSTLAFDDEDQLYFARRALERPEIRKAVLAHDGLPLAKSHLRLNHGEGEAHSNLKLIALVRGGEAAGFIREMARRLKLDATGLGQVLASESAVPLALAFCAAGLDRAVFLHILSIWQGTYERAPQMTGGQKPLVLSVFGLPPCEARRRLAVLIDQAH